MRKHADDVGNPYKILVHEVKPITNGSILIISLKYYPFYSLQISHNTKYTDNLKVTQKVWLAPQKCASQ